MKYFFFLTKSVRQRKCQSNEQFILPRIRRYRKSTIYYLNKYDISILPTNFFIGGSFFEKEEEEMETVEEEEKEEGEGEEKEGNMR